MFSFNTPNYEFMTFNPKRIEHVKAKCFLVTNPEVREYLNDTIDKNLNPKNNNAYLVSNAKPESQIHDSGYRAVSCRYDKWFAYSTTASLTSWFNMARFIVPSEPPCA